MHGKEIELLPRLNQALAIYEKQRGRRLQISDVDPWTHRAAYRRFSKIIQRNGVAPDRGEWLDFEMGRKPMLRLVLRQCEWENMQRACVSRGLVTTANPIDHETAIRLGAIDTEPSIIGFVGKDLSKLNEAAKLDARLLSDAKDAAGWRWSSRRLGQLLGYPACCVEHFVDLGSKADDRTVIDSSARHSRVFDPLLNNLSLGFYHTIGWYPCRYDCAASLDVARRVDERFRAENPDIHEQTRRILGMPRMYLDNRMQLIFDGFLSERGRLHHRNLHSVFSFDRAQGDVVLDWVFHMDVVERLRKAQWVEAMQGGIRFATDGGIDEVFMGTSPVVLPFSVGGG